MTSTGDKRAKISRIRPRIDNFENALVPKGTYTMSYKAHRLERRFDRDVLEIWFAIQDFGKYFGTALPRYYSVERLKSRGHFRAKPNSNFTREYCAIFDEKPQFKASPIARIETILVRGLVTTVTNDHEGEEIPAAAQYSRIAQLRKA